MESLKRNRVIYDSGAALLNYFCAQVLPNSVSSQRNFIMKIPMLNGFTRHRVASIMYRSIPGMRREWPPVPSFVPNLKKTPCSVIATHVRSSVFQSLSFPSRIKVHWSETLCGVDPPCVDIIIFSFKNQGSPKWDIVWGWPSPYSYGPLWRIAHWDEWRRYRLSSPFSVGHDYPHDLSC